MTLARIPRCYRGAGPTLKPSPLIATLTRAWLAPNSLAMGMLAPCWKTPAGKRTAIAVRTGLPKRSRWHAGARITVLSGSGDPSSLIAWLARWRVMPNSAIRALLTPFGTMPSGYRSRSALRTAPRPKILRHLSRSANFEPEPFDNRPDQFHSDAELAGQKPVGAAWNEPAGVALSDGGAQLSTPVARWAELHAPAVVAYTRPESLNPDSGPLRSQSTTGPISEQELESHGLLRVGRAQWLRHPTGVSAQELIAQYAYRLASQVRFGEFEFRPETGEVLERGVVVARLSETESETLMVLIKVYPLPIPRQGIVREMRRIGCYWHPDTAKVVVSRLRSKLGAAIIETHTRGYLFTPDVWMGAA